MASTLRQNPQKQQTAFIEVTENIGYFRSPMTGRRYSHAFARHVNEAYQDAWLACRHRSNVGENIDRIVSRKFSAVPICDLDFLNVTIMRAMASELATLRSTIYSAASLAREAMLSVYQEAA